MKIFVILVLLYKLIQIIRNPEMRKSAHKKFRKWRRKLKKKWRRYVRRKKKTGFTMIEVLVAVILVGAFSTAGAVTLKKSRVRAQDAERKSDLELIKTSFEDYYNDKGCYPASGSLSTCNGTNLQPYIEKVPCDPGSSEPYLYVPEGNPCSGYRVYTQLGDTTDPIIAKLGCGGEGDCGYGDGYNYGVSSGVSVYDPDGTYSPTPSPSPGSSPQVTPSPSGPIYYFACDTSGTCNRYEEGHPTLLTCPVTFEASNCNNDCGNPAFWCAE